MSDNLLDNDEKKPKTSRQLQASRTKEAIYNAAIELINKQGYQKTTIEDIVTLAGTATGTFYLYYKTKRDLIFHTLNHFDTFALQSYAIASEEQSFEGQLRSFFKFQYERIRDTGREVLKALYQNTMQDGSPMVNNLERPIYGYMRHMVEFGMETGELSLSHSVSYYNQQIIATVLGIDYYWCTFPDNIDVVELAMNRVDTLLNGLPKPKK